MTECEPLGSLEQPGAQGDFPVKQPLQLSTIGAPAAMPMSKENAANSRSNLVI